MRKKKFGEKTCNSCSNSNQSNPVFSTSNCRPTKTNYLFYLTYSSLFMEWKLSEETQRMEMGFGFWLDKISHWDHPKVNRDLYSEETLTFIITYCITIILLLALANVGKVKAQRENWNTIIQYNTQCRKNSYNIHLALTHCHSLVLSLSLRLHNLMLPLRIYANRITNWWTDRSNSANQYTITITNTKPIWNLRKGVGWV